MGAVLRSTVLADSQFRTLKSVMWASVGGVWPRVPHSNYHSGAIIADRLKKARSKGKVMENEKEKAAPEEAARAWLKYQITKMSCTNILFWRCYAAFFSQTCSRYSITCETVIARWLFGISQLSLSQIKPFWRRQHFTTSSQSFSFPFVASASTRSAWSNCSCVFSGPSPMLNIPSLLLY